MPAEELMAAVEACDQFAATQRWPAMSNSVLWQVHLRVEAANLAHGEQESAEVIPKRESKADATFYDAIEQDLQALTART